MKVIELDAGGWLTPLDFYDALLASLGAPERHGRNINALIDSMIVGDINSVEAPYGVVVTGLNKAHEDAFDELTQAFAALARHNNQAHITGNDAWVEIT
ncbi:barstar family protein [Rhizorhabdus sp.]|uniref:barstar family protein n=1 Tax=Rhizorhabdus sp. TaxID=1968843 RepID=UPI0035ADE0BB